MKKKIWSQKSFLSSLDKDAEELFKIWLASNGYSVKMSSYFATYAELLSKFRGESCTVVEIGILDGGSLFMWKEWLGPKARIIGIDLNPNVKHLEKYGFEIYIGDQGDAKFWKNFYSTVEDIDVLIDDGGHQSFQQIMTVYSAICHLKTPAIVIVEDTATSFYKTMSKYHKENSFLEFSKDSTDILTAKEKITSKKTWPNNLNEPILEIFKNVESIQFFSGIVSFKLNPRCSYPSIAINNSDGFENKSDYRKLGEITGIEIEWPSPFDNRLVKVLGENDNKVKSFSKIRFK